MNYPIYVKRGWIQVILSPEKTFDNPDAFPNIIDPAELLSCWNSTRCIVDKIVDEQIERSKAAMKQNVKIRLVVDIYNSLAVKKTVDEKMLLSEVVKTGKFTKEEAESFVKKVKEQKIEGGMAWY